MDYLTSRLLCAILVGAILSQTGSLIQLSTRNILASPSTLGFDGLGILWILAFHSLFLYLNTELPLWLIVLLGIPFFIILGLFYFHYFRRYLKVERLILFGLTFNLLVGAIFSIWQFLFLAFNLPFLSELWFGHFRFAHFDAAAILLFIELFFLASWLYFRKDFLLFSLGKNITQSLNKKNIFIFLFIFVAVGTFAVVALFGAFSFLGLIFPIVARKIWFRRFDISGEFLLGGLFNGLFLMIVDAFCYFYPIAGAEIPVGLIATTIGALSLIFLLWKSRDNSEILAKTQK